MTFLREVLTFFVLQSAAIRILYQYHVVAQLVFVARFGAFQKVK